MTIQRYIRKMRLISMKRVYAPLLATVFGLIMINPTQSQHNLGFEHYLDIPVVQNNDTLRFAWMGGLNNPQFSSLDLNMDGSNDIIAFERDGEHYRAFIWNEDGTYSPDFELRKSIPVLKSKYVGKNFVLFRDYDGDGLNDIFAPGYNNQGLDVWHNTSVDELSFEKVGDKLTFEVADGSDRWMIFKQHSVPVITDFNGDGDIDIMLQGFSVFGTRESLMMFENQSVDFYGVPDSLVFKLSAPCWGKIAENSDSAGWEEYYCDTSGFNVNGDREDRHGGTSLATFDLNGDGTLDLLTGDAYGSRIQAHYNQLISVDGIIDLEQTDHTFPSNNTPIDLPTLPAVYFEDVDHDGLLDILASPTMNTAQGLSAEDTSIMADVDWYYQNTGTASQPSFTLQKKGFFSSEMLDVGARSMPALADINGDGLLDLFVGNEGYTYWGGEAGAYITLYLNVGTSTNPVFQKHDDNVGNIRSLDFGYVHPTFADLDDDGDMDMVIGEDQGSLHYFENTGSAINYEFTLTEPEFAGIDVDLGAHPQFFDGNNDGIEDLMIGDYYGRVHYHENEGSNTVHDFSKNATVSPVGEIMSYHDHGGESTPFFTRRLDSLGTNLYMLLSNADGKILVYGPITDLTTLGDPMEAADSILVDATFTSITGANLYGDFRDELIIGQRTGGLYVLNRAKEIPIGITEANRDETSNALTAYPNPSSGNFDLQFDQNDKTPVKIEVTDISGRVVLSVQREGKNRYQLDLENKPKGIYMVTLTQNDTQHWVRVVTY